MGISYHFSGPATGSAAVKSIIEMFSVDRCFFASNYPVDWLEAQGSWTPEKLYPAFLQVRNAYARNAATRQQQQQH